MLHLRILSALVLVPGTVMLMWIGAWPFRAYVALAAAIAALEYFTITERDRPTRLVGVGLSVALTLSLLVPGVPWSPGGVVAGVVLALFVYFTIRPGEIRTAIARMGVATVGVLYAGVLLCFFAWLRDLPNGFGWAGVALATPWCADTSAYFVGRFLGRHKLYPAVSPNKTVEGALGGLAGAVGGVFLARAIAGLELAPVHAVAIGVLAGAAGQLGDLAESLLKRAYEVKDSGRILPGHGGVLDRYDALMFAAPVVYGYARLVLGM